MFTLLVSWLLVLCVPGLLMLTTLGLERLERLSAHEAVTTTDVDEFLIEQAAAVDMHTLAREGLPEALDYLHRRQSRQYAGAWSDDSEMGRHRPEAIFARNVDGRADDLLPPRIYPHSHVNPHFTATRHINGV